ncbi:hypothetical protein M9979_13225 [Sphingomonas sp. RP10(2022)]|uniref:Uncharacterized protein n=1 Tax=Sphingomonas liriopis TaxID=2949094 RepID=A0A9X2KRP8_9SPHN|nr:hypothetical protein [Sphingomonas liriopis]MCP3735836.1 hypothetical protein [Sphingomonas liriopis]
MVLRRVDSTTYYDTLPGLAHECGDIWRNLPAFGTLGQESCCGIIITPACDLSWQKSDTLTYLPIIPLRSFFSMDAALPGLVEKLVAALGVIPCETTVSWTGNSYIVPPEDEIARLESDLKAFRSAQQRSAKINSAIDRVLAGADILRCIRDSELIQIPSDKLFALYGSEWGKIKERIVQNSYSPALHFLPHDRQDLVFSAVPNHSVVLFRYPITIPVRVLSRAQESADASWTHSLDLMSLAPALRVAFGNARPVKLAALKPAFLADLLTRFSALYNRVGSPDFSAQTVETYVQEVDG